MRINVYSQELTNEIQLVGKPTVGPDGESRMYYGVRMYLASPDILHHTPDDDDRSAITFWVPQNDTFSPMDLANLLREMGQILEDHYYPPVPEVDVNAYYDDHAKSEAAECFPVEYNSPIELIVGGKRITIQ